MTDDRPIQKPTRETISTPLAPRPAGPYSQAIRVKDLVHVSGQVPRQADGTYVPAEVPDETRLTLDNLARIAEAAGGTLADTVKITAYLSRGEYFDDFNRAYADYFPGPPPARTTVVAGLREVKVEMDAVLFIEVTARRPAWSRRLAALRGRRRSRDDDR